MADLHKIPLDLKIKAFQHASEQTKFTEGKLILLTEDKYDAALIFARDSFTKDEPINRAVNTQWFPELKDMWLETFRCNLTIAVIDEVSGDVIAIRGTRVLDKDYEFDNSNIDDPGFNILWGIIGYCDERAKFFERFQVKQAFQFFGFGVRSDYLNRGIGSRLFKVAMDMLTYLVKDPFCIKGETSSIYSSQIYEKNKFVKLFELPFKDYLVDGKQVICNTGDHKSLKIWGIKVNG